MKVVIYTEDLIPITVIDLPQWAVAMLKDRQFIDIPVPPKCVTFRAMDEPIKIQKQRRVIVRAEIFRKPVDSHQTSDYGRRIQYYESLMLFTKNEEEALELRAAFLPGQELYMRDFVS